jgi:hypothetical protein
MQLRDMRMTVEGGRSITGRLTGHEAFLITSHFNYWEKFMNSKPAPDEKKNGQDSQDGKTRLTGFFSAKLPNPVNPEESC